jgi:hypothetical protein
MQKLTAFAALIAGNAAAFSSVKQIPSRSALQESTLIEPIAEPPAEPVLPKMSQSLPFLPRPIALTGELAGDVGFDPLGFAKSSEELMNFREAELKHARLAMLAAAGWPISEVLDKKIAGM